MRDYLTGLLLAIQFLTRIPVPGFYKEVTDVDLGRSVYAFPVVGLLLGAILLATASLFSYLPSMLTAAIVLAVWVLLTGNLHLDGLADTADGWAGGQGQKDRILAIMKDSRSGAAAISIVVCVLILKFAALNYIVANKYWIYLVLVPMIARGSILLFFMSMDYAREKGLSSPYIDRLSKAGCYRVLLACVVALVLFTGWTGLWLALICALAFVAYRWYWQNLLGGFTGDIIGAWVEILEVLMLVAAIALLA